MASLIFERCQCLANNAPTILTVAQGEAGEGIYAYVPSLAMRKYYASKGESCFRLQLIEGDVIDFKGEKLIELVSFIATETQHFGKQTPGYIVPVVTKNNVQRFGWWISVFMKKFHPEAIAYIVLHRGPGIPTGRQVVILDISKFKITKLF